MWSAADSSEPRSLSVGCQLMRVTTLAAGGYVGYLIGGLIDLPTFGAGLPSGVVVGAEVLGTVAGVVWAADAPLLLRLPLCPASLRTVWGRPARGRVTVWRASTGRYLCWCG